MTWDGLAVGARWKCGHPKTPENTQTGHRQSPKCKECHRQYSREYMERKRNENMAEEFDEPMEGERPMNENQLTEWAQQELTRLGACGIVGDEFERARKRYENERRRRGRNA